MMARPRAVWTHPAAPWCACGLFLVVNLIAAGIGSQLGHTLQEQQAADVIAEDRVVCARLSAPPGSEHFIGCATELDGVRHQHGRRIAAWESPL
jgi:hypothetical protein